MFGNALFINLHVICAMQIMSVIRPDTSINALPNISIPLSVNIQELKPSLNTQSDSISAKLFV